MFARSSPSAEGGPRGVLRIRRGVVAGRSAIAVRSAAVAVVALGITLAASAFVRDLPADPRWTPLALGVGVLALAAYLRPVEPAPGEKLSLAAAAAFFGALILPGAFAVTSVAVAAAAAKIVRRRSLLDLFANVAQAVGATAAASLAASSLPGGAGVIAGALSYAAVTLGSVALMIAVLQDVSRAADFLRREFLPTGVLVAVGGIASVVWMHDPLLLVLFIPVLATIEIASRRAATARAAQEVRERAQSAQKDFAVNAAHELRTPLASVIGDLDFLAGLALAPAEASALASARQEARRAAGLVERLLVLARAGTAEAATNGDVSGAAARVAARAARGSDLPIDLDVPETLPVSVSDELLEVLIGDLLQNAVSYTPEGRISVSARRSGPRVEIVVADTGIGIPPEELPRVLDRFYRGARARSMAPGTGLGLAIVRQIVEAHGGGIAIDSASGGGTTVTVRLPAVGWPQPLARRSLRA